MIEDFIESFESSIEGIPEGSVTPQTRLADLAQWDSLARLTTIALLESEYSTDVTAAQLNRCDTVQEVFDLTKG